MPSKYPSRRKRIYRKKRIHRKKKGLARMVRKIASKVVHQNIENKVTCTQVDSQVVDYADGTGFAVNGNDLLANIYQSAGQTLGVGDGEINQGVTGLQFRARYLEIKGNLLGYGDNHNLVRMLVVEDKQASNNTQLQLYNNGIAFDNLILQTDQLMSPINKFKRFKVLYDKMHNFGTSTTLWNTFNIRINMKNALFKYYPTTTTGIYELNKRLRIYFIGLNTSFTSTQNPTVQYMSRLTFEDA